MKLYMAQVQVIVVHSVVRRVRGDKILERGTTTTSYGLPTFFVFAMDAKHAKAQVHDVAKPACTSEDVRYHISGAVCLAKFNAVGSGNLYGFIDNTGEDYLGWSDLDLL